MDQKKVQISVTEAKGRLTELVRRSEQGDEVVLARHARPVVRLVPVRTAPDRAARRELLERLRTAGGRKASKGPPAARSQDFLYDRYGLPK